MFVVIDGNSAYNRGLDAVRLMWEQSRNPPTLKEVPGATDLGRNDVKNLQVGSDCTGVVIHWL